MFLFPLSKKDQNLSFALSSSKGSGTYHWSPRFLATCLGQVYTPTPTHLQLILPSPHPPTSVLSASREWEKPLSLLGFLPQQLTLPMACCLCPQLTTAAVDRAAGQSLLPPGKGERTLYTDGSTNAGSPSWGLWEPRGPREWLPISLQQPCMRTPVHPLCSLRSALC